MSGYQVELLPACPVSDLSRLGVIFANKVVEVGSAGVTSYLLDILAAGNHTRDGRMFQTPRKRPLRHGNALGDLFASDPLYLFELPLYYGRVVTTAHIGFFEGRTGLVFTAEVSAREGYTGEDAEIVRLAQRQDFFFRRAIEPVVNDLYGFAADFWCFSRLVVVRVFAD